MAEKIRILQLIWELDTGGAEYMLKTLVEGLDKDRFENIVVSLYPIGAVGKEMEAEGINVQSLNIKNNFLAPLAIPSLVALIRKNRIDILQSQLFLDNMMARIAGKIAGVPVINSKLDTDRYKPILRVLVDKYTVPLADAIVSNSRAGEREWLERGVSKDKVFYIPNGKDFSKFDNEKDDARKRLGISENETVCGVVSRLEEQKGHRYLLEATPAIIKEHPNTRFLIVGEGSLERQLKDQAKSLGVADKVIFTGRVDRVTPYLRMMDIFVFPTLWEGMPGALMEAMALGIPAVATDVDGNNELMENGKNGLLVPVKNPEALAKMVNSLLTDEPLRRKMGAAASKSMRENFSLRNMVEKYEKLYERLCKKR